jgi:DNA polymerase III subunit beta
VKIKVERDVFADAIAWTARSVPTRPGTLPQLAGILMRTGADGLTLSGFDYETSATATLPADVADEGQVLVSGRLLADISRSLPNRPIDVALDGQKLAVRCGSSRFSLQTMPIEDYPTLPEMPDVIGSVDTDIFASAVGQAVTAAGRDDMLPVLTGVKLEMQGTTLALLATDRFRLSSREIPWRPLQTDMASTALVPARVLAETARSMTTGNTLELALSPAETSNGLIGFATKGQGGTRLTTTRLIDGAFPNVRQLFPNTSNVTAEIAAAALIDSVKRVSLVAGRNTPVRLTFSAEGLVTLEAGNGEEAQASESLEAVVEGGDITIGFNPTYLLDGLGAVAGSHVHIAMTEAGRPAAFTSLPGADEKPDPDFSYLLMPLRMQG